MNKNFREKALYIIKKQNEKKSAGIEDVSQQAIDASRRLDSATKQNDPEMADYMQLVQDHKFKYGVSLIEAMRAVEKEFPYARRAYIRKNNPHIKFDEA